MKSLLCLGISLLFTLMLTGRAPAQTERPLDDVPIEVRTADHLSDVQRQEVRQYVAGWVSVLQDNSNPLQQGIARDKLSDGITPLGTETFSIDYENEYSTQINDALLPLIKGNQMRVQLLAGIVAGRVAERTANVALVPAAVALLSDNSDAVIIWGMRTARSVYPTLLRGGVSNAPLGTLMAKVLGEHPEIPLAGDAYAAIDLPVDVGGGVLQGAAQEALLLIQTRVEVYQRVAPVDPSADSTATTFLSTSACWAALTPVQQFDTVQQISNLLSVMARRCLADGQDQMTRTLSGLQPVAGAVYVIGTTLGAPDVVNAAKPVAQQRFLPTTPPQQIIDLVAKVYPALKAVPAFAKIQPSPPLQAAPTTKQ